MEKTTIAIQISKKTKKELQHVAIEQDKSLKQLLTSLIEKYIECYYSNEQRK